MKYPSLGRACLSAVLVLSMLLPWLVTDGVESRRIVRQDGPPYDQPEEQIIPAERGMEKLAPDLRAIAEVQPAAALIGTLYAPILAETPSIMVSALLEPGTEVRRLFRRSVTSRVVSGVQWETGLIETTQLRKLASVEGVLGVFSVDTYQTTEAPGLDEMRAAIPRMDLKEARALVAAGGVQRLEQQAAQLRATMTAPSPAAVDGLPAAPAPVTVPGLMDIHDVRPAHDLGYRGEGVVVAVVDTGVDFAHPDLDGTHAVISGGPYDGWPFAYDTLSAANYALDPLKTLGPDNFWGTAGLTQYVKTRPVVNPICSATTCGADLALSLMEGDAIVAHFSWPNTSKSGDYFYSIHPDPNLAYAAYYGYINYKEGYLLSPPLIVADEHQPGVYDAVYVDTNFNYRLEESERMDKAHPTGGGDINQDGTWDISAGMLTWIADGEHQPPGVAAVYPQVDQYDPPESGRLVTFVSDQDGHGTNCASQIAGQGRLMDPQSLGPANPLYAGGADKGGVGGAVIQSMAPGARIAAFQNGFDLPLDAWTLAVLGMDGLEGTGDEANIVSNSWGDSGVIADGWDAASRFAHLLNTTVAKEITFLVATGNGGHGYGTVTAPAGGTIIDVGASTAYGALRPYETVGPEQYLYGDIQPWSNRGPTALGDVAPDLVATGAWGTGANPLNIYFPYYKDGQAAYDVFGGTSMATPVAAGNLALVYQAFLEHNQRWPSWQEASAILEGSAQDLGYDVFTQGSGAVQAARAVEIAAGRAPSVNPVQWRAGGYQDQSYISFPSVMKAGQQDRQTFTVTNPTAFPVSAAASALSLSKVHEETFTFSYTPQENGSPLELPLRLEEFSQLIAAHDPDMVRAQVSLPADAFDADNDLWADSWWGVYWYDWTDLNEDGNLWTDLNQDGLVQEPEIDIDAATGKFEFNRFTYGYPQGTSLEASVGRAALSRSHDGVFLGLRCFFCGNSTTMQVRVTFYKHSPWNWLEVTPAEKEIGAGLSEPFEAVLTVPAGTPPGSYSGALEFRLRDQATIVPVVVNVAADGDTFQFGGETALDEPFDNSHWFGGFNWRWRYESGDWRFFYYDVGEQAAGPGKAMVVETSWSDPGTDLDIWVFSPAEDEYSRGHPQTFGPRGIAFSGGSQDSYVMDGKYHWKTNTGYARELVASAQNPGLGLIAMHNVRNGGRLLGEGFEGKVYRVSTTPGEVLMETLPKNHQQPVLTVTQEIALQSTGDLKDGVRILPYGMSEPIELEQQIIHQDPSDLCSTGWVYQKEQGGLTIEHGGLLEITTTAQTEGLDLDLFLFADNGDGVWNCGKETVKTYSMNAGADEQIKIYFPQDGRYWLIIQGVAVPNKTQPFDLRIRAIQGANLTLRNLPLGPIQADQPARFSLTASVPYLPNSPVAMEGLLLIGPPSMPVLLEVPVRIQPTVLLYPQPSLIPETRWLAEKPVLFRLPVENKGANAELLNVTITLPPGSFYQPGSLSPDGAVDYDPITRVITWQGEVNGGEVQELRFLVSAQQNLPPAGPVTVQAEVVGVNSGQRWVVDTSIWLNTHGLLLPVIHR